MLRADVDALVTVLLNLLDNACNMKASWKRTRAPCAGRDQICLAVEDHGIGLSPRHRAQESSTSFTRLTGSSRAPAAVAGWG